MQRCKFCSKESLEITKLFKCCRDCLVENFGKIKREIEELHKKTRVPFNLPYGNGEEGIKCSMCVRGCKIGKEERGFCGLKTVKENKLKILAGDENGGLLSWYKDPLPTNCVADWVCEGHIKYGYHNLAVFYKTCTLNCLYCQNWHFRETDILSESPISPEELASVADSYTFCVCFFGGDPVSQILHAIKTAEILAERGIKICWETNGLFSKNHLYKALDLSIQTKGKLKFDIKAGGKEIYYSFTGYDGEKVFENFKLAALHAGKEKAHQVLVASTLLVPGYINSEEIRKIARFIASINPKIPYALLGFSPHFYLNDLPTTSWKQAKECYKTAQKEGLLNIRIGNQFLLR